jgi:hypothetical protein
MDRVVRAAEIGFQPYAVCACGWEHPISVHALTAAKAHVKSTGHEVDVIRETVSRYVLEKANLSVI